MREIAAPSWGTPVATSCCMTSNYPVSVDVTSPPRFDRIQVLLRIALALALGWIGISMDWVVCILFVALPMVAAISLSTIGGERFANETAPRVVSVLSWLLQLSAFMMLLTDRFPTGGTDAVRIGFRFTGSPTTGSALIRLLTSIPSGLVLCVLWFVSGVLWLVAAVMVLVSQTVPRAILTFQRGVLRWQARLVAYHASLVEEYPPFALDTEDAGGTLTASKVS